MILDQSKAKFLTDAQWLTLMDLVSDEKTIRLSMPPQENSSCILFREGIKYEIHPSGSYDSYET